MSSPRCSRTCGRAFGLRIPLCPGYSAPGVQGNVLVPPGDQVFHRCVPIHSPCHPHLPLVPYGILILGSRRLEHMMIHHAGIVTDTRVAHTLIRLGPGTVPPSSHGVPDSSAPSHPPPYSTDIRAAWQIVDQLIARRCDVALFTTTNDL